MKKYISTLLFATLGLAACSSDTEQPLSGYGSVRLNCEASDIVLTRAEQFTVPTAGEFSLTITDGAESTQTWPSFTDFNPADNKFPVGNYTATVLWGDPAQEGIDKPCYTGSTSYTILSDQTIEEQITARLGNALVKVVCTEQFNGYFHDATFRLTTEAGNEFAPVADGAPIFVRSGASFSIEGSAVKQNGSTVTLPRQTISQAVAQTLYTYKFDVSGAGNTTITITLDDTPLAEIPIDGELNPNA